MTANQQQPQLRGAIPRIERQESHYRFLWAVRPQLAMVDLTHGARIAMHDQQFFPPETDVILTSTITDSELVKYSFRDELQLIRELEPKYALPFDFPVYGDMPAEKREEHVRQVASGTEDMAAILGPLTDDEITRISNVKDLPRDLVAGTSNTTIIPLLKGTTPAERRIIIDTAHRINAPVIAKYGVQYMTVGGNGSHTQLCNDLATISNETNGYPTLIIGLLSPNGRYSLEGVPDNVVAAAGTNQWLKHVEPTSNTTTEMQTAYEVFYNAVAETLGTQQRYHASIARGASNDPPAPLQKTPGHAVGDDLSPSLSGASETGGYGFGERKRPDTATDAVTAGRKGGQQTPQTGDQ